MHEPPSEQIDAPELTMARKAMTRKAIVVTIEGLGTNLVGCYGGAIAPTKNWDRLASQSIVYDQFWCDSIDPLEVLESMWTGTHVLKRAHLSADDRSRCSAPSCLGALLVSDRELPASSSGLAFFDEVQWDDFVGKPDEAEGSAIRFSRLLESGLARWIERLEETPVLWIHSSGLHAEWDGPLELRRMMCDEEDPEPPPFTAPPSFFTDAHTDPDQLFGVVCGAGGQAIAMDHAWGLIDDALASLGLDENTLVILAGVNGYPLGEHHQVGTQKEDLYSERLHAPLIVRPGNQLPLGLRIPFFVQPHSLRSTLEHWLGSHADRATAVEHDQVDLAFPHESLSVRDWGTQTQYAVSGFGNQRHIAVPGWSGRWTIPSASDPLPLIETDLSELEIELFAMPDDRWQQNQISDRARSAAIALLQFYQRWETPNLDVGLPEPLSDELLCPHR